MVCARCGASLAPDARFCPACAAPVLDSGPVAEERKLVTVVFADLVGSTELADAQDPERTRVVLDRFHESMAAEIERVGGTVEKFIGDAVMAAFGAPVAQEDHAERALHAALAMQRRLGDLFSDQLALRIGVNTGEVVVGRPREGSSFVTGDAVNVGARLEQAAAPGEILAGERTVLSARGAFEFGELLTVEAKGKAGGLQCRRLVRALSLMRPRGVGGLHRAFVGRELELARLQEAYRAVAADGRPQLVTILGDAGVGKTRLVRELWEWFAGQEEPPLRRTGRCLSYGQGITYWPLAEVMKEHFRILESDSPQVVADRLRDRPYLALTIGLAPEENLHPLVARERLHDSWIDFLDGLVAERATVVLIEDMHWAEDDLCDLLETLVSRVDGPLLLVATARPELFDRRPGWSGRQNGFRLELEALPPADAGRLLDGLLGVELPAAVRQVVVQRAEGNPFFVEELVATLIDLRVLGREDGGWSVGELPSDFRVPDSVQAVLAARIDMLPADEKAALQAAAVIGRIFWTGPVYELVGGARPDFGLLEDRDFVRRRVGSSIAGEREYAIKHALTREVAYASVPKAKRAQLHAGFAGWLERSAERDDEHTPLLAYHYLEAVRPDDSDLAWAGREADLPELRRSAIAWARRAASQALSRYEVDESIVLFRKALELEPDPVGQARLWEEIGHANALKYDGEAFFEAMEHAIELGEPSAELYAELAVQAARRGGMWKRELDPEIVLGWVEKALGLAEQASPARARALAASAILTESEDAARAAHEIAEQAGDVGLRLLTLWALAFSAWGNGALDRAIPRLEEWRACAQRPEVTDPDDRGAPLFAGGFIDLAAGRIRIASEASWRLDEIISGLTPHHRVHGIGGRLHVAAVAGRWEEVRELTPRAEAAVEANADTPCAFNVGSLLNAALASAYLGGDAESERLEAKADAIGMEGYRMWLVPPRIRLAIARNDPGELRRLVDAISPSDLEPWSYEMPAAMFDALVALGDREAIEADAPKWLRPKTYAEPFALRALGFARGDETMLTDAAARFDGMELEWFAEETRRLLGSSK
ncbi:MAG TPA: adenylate/guanylate cyclase domain-containing protein [Gaiellales bacterium]|nr:adenylate/guanylate cyclase domain-containing protein [Gaiellales bacterium]